MKKRYILPAVLLAISIIYLLGPRPAQPAYDTALPDLPASAAALETYVESRESRHKIKPDNEARIVWADPAIKQKTPVAVVYLHGFSASRREGFPAHVRFAKKFGCNLYLARLSDHGIDTVPAMAYLTADRLWNSAKEAYAIGKQLGDEVVLMGTSTGSTLALKLASEYPEVKGLINFAPNIEINDPAAFLLDRPWGLQIARLYFGGKTRSVPSDSVYRRYWYDTYRLEATTELQRLLRTAAVPEVFEKITCPVWSGFYYRDEAHQDPTVKVSAIKEMHSALGTPAEKQAAVAFPHAETHVIACDLLSKSVDEVMRAAENFAEEVMGMEPVHAAVPVRTP